MFNMNYLLSQEHIRHLIISVNHYEEPPTYTSPIMSVLSGLRGCLLEMKSLINKPGLPAITALRPDSISIAEIKHPGPVDRPQKKIHLLPLFLIGGRGQKSKGCRGRITICFKDYTDSCMQ